MRRSWPTGGGAVEPKEKKIIYLIFLECKYFVSFEILFSKSKIFNIQVIWQNAG
jgi:hypothetical protein